MTYRLNPQLAEHFDDAQTVFLREQLTNLKREAIRIEFPEFKARSLIPVKTETSTGDEYVEFKTLERIGRSKIIADYAKDFPSVTLRGTSHIGRIKSLGASYGFSIQEIRNAAKAGVALSTELATAAKEAIIEQENQIAFFGDNEHRLYGMFNNPNIPRSLAPAGVGGIDWTLKTPNEIIADMNQVVNGVSENSLGIHMANVLLLPLSKYNAIASTPRSATSDTTILAWFLQNNPYIQRVIWLNELETASSSGDAMAVAYKLDPSVLQLDIPQDFEVFPEQVEGMRFSHPCHSRIAGVHIYKPLAINFLEDF
jgi:hypothetical protein